VYISCRSRQSFSCANKSAAESALKVLPSVTSLMARSVVSLGSRRSVCFLMFHPMRLVILRKRDMSPFGISTEYLLVIVAIMSCFCCYVSKVTIIPFERQRIGAFCVKSGQGGTEIAESSVVVIIKYATLDGCVPSSVAIFVVSACSIY